MVLLVCGLALLLVLSLNTALVMLTALSKMLPIHAGLEAATNVIFGLAMGYKSVIIFAIAVSIL